VLSDRGSAVPLSQDHRPDRETEKFRIEARGGAVVCWSGMSRVQGVLGVTRAFGDRDLKTYITAEPDVVSHRLTAASEFVVLATDGVWDFVGNQEVVDLVRAHVLNPQGGKIGRSASASGKSSRKDDDDRSGADDQLPSPTISLGSSACSSSNSLASTASGDDACEMALHSGDEDTTSARARGAISGQVAISGVRQAVASSQSQGTFVGADIACRELIQLALSRGSRDDISALVVDVRSYCHDYAS
jgi:hypothetical protein